MPRPPSSHGMLGPARCAIAQPEADPGACWANRLGSLTGLPCAGAYSVLTPAAISARSSQGSASFAGGDSGRELVVAECFFEVEDASKIFRRVVFGLGHQAFSDHG